MTRLGSILGILLLAATGLTAGDWLHWRGPDQNGTAREPIPENFDVTEVGKNGLLWKQPYGGRSAPLVMNGKMYFLNGFDTAKATEGERLVCLDAETGKLEWETRFSVFHTDIVSVRLGWTSVTADPKEGVVFAHTTAGHLMAVDAKTGKVKWQRQLTEEFGRVTGYGGRIASPIYDDGLVIIGLVNGSWGDQGRGNNRFVAFDAKTGEVAWWSSPTETMKNTSVELRGTYYSNPVITNVKGQRVLLSGAADGCIHALKVRTGERLWSYHFSSGVINPSPVVDGDRVYICHGEENPGGGSLGRVVCLDMSEIKDFKPKVVWDQKNLGRRFGLASPAFADGKLYVPEDGGELFCFDGKTGKQLWKQRFGTLSRGAPLICGGKAYIFEVFGKLSVIPLGAKKPNEDDILEFAFKPLSGKGQLETNGTPIAVNGKLYFQTLEEIYCIGTPGSPPSNAEKSNNPETPFDDKAAPAGVTIFPADVTAKPGDTVKFTLKFVDGNGRVLPTPADAKAEWVVPLPPKSPAGFQPPAMAAKVEGNTGGATLVLEKLPSQQGYVDVTVGTFKARARVRVAPLVPMKQDFSKLPAGVGASPAGWINALGKYEVIEVELDGTKQKVLSKINNNPRPPIARANAFITTTDATNYTVQADMRAGEVGGKLPDMGVVANRYLFSLDGKEDLVKKTKQLRIVSWEARNRVNQSIDFDWKKDTWYTVKFTVAVDGDKATVKGKVWERGKDEPAEWSMTYVDPFANKEGAAAIYGYISNVTEGDAGIKPGSPIYYQNVSVTPNK